MRFNHVTLVVTDLERSKAFYRTLGLRQLVDAPPRYARFTFPDGDATVSLEVTDDARAVSPALAQLFFECDDVDGTVAALTSGLRRRRRSRSGYPREAGRRPLPEVRCEGRHGLCYIRRCWLVTTIS